MGNGMKNRYVKQVLAFSLAACMMGNSWSLTAQAAELETMEMVDVTEDTEEVEDTEAPEVVEETANTEEIEESEAINTENDTEPEILLEEVGAPAEILEEVAQTVSEEAVVTVTAFSSNEEMTAYLESNPAEGLRLMVLSETEPKEFYGATSAVTFDGVWMLTYETMEACSAAYNAYRATDVVVTLDATMEASPDDEIIANVTPEDVPAESMEMQLEAAIAEEEREEGTAAEVTVAILDTGVDPQVECLQGRLSPMMKENMTDANGHGTVMAEIVANQTTEQVRILPIAIFDENGRSTVAKVYFGMKEAMEQGASVINISACAPGDSPVLSQAIAAARSQGIVVVVAAGNEASDTAAYMPANVSEAITVAAVDKEERFADYSNYGDQVDFAAMGILRKDMGTKDVEDDLVYMGTSISAAYVSSFAAVLLSEDADCDVYQSFLASAKDLGEEGYDPYYGYGLLTRESIVRVISNKKADEEVLELEDLEGGEESLSTAYFFDFLFKRAGRELDSQCYYACGRTRVKKRKIGSPNDKAHIHIGCGAPTEENAIEFCETLGLAKIWRQGNYVFSRNPSDHATFENCTFYNCWIENYFDVIYENCTFYNCHFSNCGGCNTVTFQHCNINPDGASPWSLSQGQLAKSHNTYAGVLGGLSTRWILDDTTVNGAGATCAISDCHMSSLDGFVPGVYLYNGSRVYGGSVCAVDVWLSNSRDVEVVVDSDSKIENSPVGIYNQGRAYLKSGTISGCRDAGMQNWGDVAITGGIIRGADGGLFNYGTVTMSGGEITGNTKGISNMGEFTQKGGKIHHNLRNGVETSGTFYKQGGVISSNGSWGIHNTGTVNLSSGEITGNEVGGVYQDGTLHMAGDGAVSPQNRIYLTQGHVVTVTGPLNAAEAGRFDMEAGDRKTGRPLIQLYAADSAVGETISKKFSLAFQENIDIHNEDCYDEQGNLAASAGSHVRSIIRPGFGSNQNAAADQVILSGCYYANFEPNMVSMGGLQVQLPFRGNQLFYGESYLPKTPSHAYTTGTGNRPIITLTMADGTKKDVSKAFQFLGWALDPNEMDQSKIYTTDQARAMYGDFHWYAIWNARFDLLFDGNGQTKGENYRKDDWDLFSVLPGNVSADGTKENYFQKYQIYKASEKTWFDKNREAYVDYQATASYQGWSIRPDAMRGDADVMNGKNPEKDTLGEVLGITSYRQSVQWLCDLMSQGRIKEFDEFGRAIVPVYVVWDEAPVVEAYDIYLTKDEVDGLTEADLWRNVTARDREDGTLKNQVDVTLVDFRKDDLKALTGDRGGVSLTYKAVDSAGNTAFYDVYIMISSNEAITSWNTNADGSVRDTANYLRFIDRKNYKKNRIQDGGMEQHSLWYVDPEYARILTTSFDNIDRKKAVISYQLDASTMKEIQKYASQHKNQMLEPAYRSHIYKTYLKPHIRSGR